MPKCFLLLQPQMMEINPKSRCSYSNKWVWFNLCGITCRNCWDRDGTHLIKSD